MDERLKVHIRWAIRRDMERVLEIERQSFGEYCWLEEDFIRCLRQRNCICMVAADNEDAALGFMVYELHKTRLHLLNFAVSPDVRRQGVGRQMIDKLTGKLATQRRNRITAEVRETNMPGQFFFRSCGFRAVSILSTYYDDSDDDAYLMTYRFTDDVRSVRPVNRIDRMEG